MPHLDEQGRPEPPLAADETATLLGFLEYQRATLAWKCAGLDAAGLGATVAASSMTLGGLLKHLAYVEDAWCSRWLHGRDRQPPWDTVDWKADPDWDWHSAAEDTPEQLPDALAGHRGPLPLPGHRGAGRRRPGAAGPAHLARRSGTQPAMDPVPPGRGVRAAQRPCRPPPGAATALMVASTSPTASSVIARASAPRSRGDAKSAAWYSNGGRNSTRTRSGGNSARGTPGTNPRTRPPRTSRIG
jgi:hypothetical protein